MFYKVVLLQTIHDTLCQAQCTKCYQLAFRQSMSSEFLHIDIIKYSIFYYYSSYRSFFLKKIEFGLYFCRSFEVDFKCPLFLHEGM